MSDCDDDLQTCGIVMPISPIEGYRNEHWSDVLQIINEAVELAGLKPNLVSEADDSGSIHKRIVQNLYDNPIVVCDVSAKNPNVMFELGMRLAFDKPTIIIKDEETSYSFDTSSIEHLSYPKDLRFSSIVTFKEKLAAKIRNTLEASKDPAHTTFLKHFGEFKVAKIDTKEVGADEYILDEIISIKNELRNIKFLGEKNRPIRRRHPRSSYLVDFSECDPYKEQLNLLVSNKNGFYSFESINGEKDKYIFTFEAIAAQKRISEIEEEFPGVKVKYLEIKSSSSDDWRGIEGLQGFFSETS